MRIVMLTTAHNLRHSLKASLLGNKGAVAMVSLLSLCLLLLAFSRPFSSLYSALHSAQTLSIIATDRNNQRTDAALDYFRSLPKRSLQDLQAMSPHAGNGSFTLTAERHGNATPSSTLAPTFTIVLITVSRRQPPGSERSVGYVVQSAASLHSLVQTQPLLKGSSLFVCNVDPHPHNHEDAAGLRDYLPYVERYGGSVVPGLASLPVPGSEELYRDSKQANSFDQERSDYTFCLQAALSFPASYYLVFQDDAIPHPDFSAVLQLSLAKLTKADKCLQDSTGSDSDSLSSSSSTSSSSGSSSTSSGRHSGGWWTSLFSSYSSCLSELPPYTSHSLPPTPRPISPSPDTPFGYLKFYFPERWQGFALELIRLLDLTSMGCVGGGIGLILQALIAPRKKTAFEPSWRAFWLGILLTLLVSLLVGRLNINEMRRLSKFFYRLQPPPACCIPAMLYPAPVMPFLVTWLAESPRKSKVDLRISDFFHHHDIPTYYVEPNVVHHVGMVTSLSKRYKKPTEEFVLFR